LSLEHKLILSAMVLSLLLILVMSVHDALDNDDPDFSGPSARAAIVRITTDDGRSIPIPTLTDERSNTFWARDLSEGTQSRSISVEVWLSSPVYVDDVRWLFSRADAANAVRLSVARSQDSDWNIVTSRAQAPVGIWQSARVGRVAQRLQFTFYNPDDLALIGGLAEIEIRQ
jgi:hypothetical protein